MSKYNEYAERVNRAFIRAKKQFDEAYRKYNEAQAAHSDLQREILQRRRIEEYPGENQVAMSIAKANLEAALFEMENVKRTAFPAFEDELMKIEKELHSAVAADQVINPDDVDNNTMMLINSGIIGGDDINALFEKFHGNATMRRLLADYAGKKASELDDRDPDQARKFRFAKAAHYEDSDVIRRFEDLKGIAIIYSGAYRGHRDSIDFIHSISDEWMKRAVQETIENF